MCNICQPQEHIPLKSCVQFLFERIQWADGLKDRNDVIFESPDTLSQVGLQLHPDPLIIGLVYQRRLS